MDAESADIPLPVEMVRLPSRSPSRGKSPARLARSDYAVGIGLLLVVVFLWTSSNFVTQDLFEGGYEKPFLVTYLTTSSFALYLLPFIGRRLLSRYRGERDGETTRIPSSGYEPLVTEAPEDNATPYIFEYPDAHGLPPLTTRETAHLALAFCFLWFIANWSLNAGLNYTSVASATILSSMSGFFTLIIGRIFHVDNFTLAKVGAVATSFAGVILVSLSDSGNSTPVPAPTADAPQSAHSLIPLLGDSLALLSAFFYAFYVILLKVRIRSESRVDMQLFFGFVGLFNILALWPLGVVLHFTRVEVFELPTSRRSIAGLLINMAITLSSDYIYVLAMLKTTPLVVTVGLSLTMPLAVIGDLLLHHPVHSQVVVGAFLVLASFVVVGLADSEKPPEAVVVPSIEGDSEDIRGRRASRVHWSEEVEVRDIEHVEDDG
ncbi:vacuolar membrane protein [Auriscalpium vulgare]|uniref:Vacuolar membrane protein n=1 Tax=Auriscalpium vulgare TaxID=40419 RepID=A0ACB8S5T1_9AGAM|nr:vacuolar membrane protein [Auriscalpium vulgare]